MENGTNLDYQRISFIFEHVQLALSLIGVIGNFLAIIIFSRRSLSKYSFSFYSRAMAISDICFLSYNLTYWIEINFTGRIETLGLMFCKMIEFVPYFFVSHLIA